VLAAYATELPIHVKPVVTAPSGTVPLLAMNPTWFCPELGVMYNSAPLMLAESFEVMVQGTVESEVSMFTMPYQRPRACSQTV
jgi:hypothetical protein